ncbi:hypothetical protein STEG23_032957, partial [Scotinomys teguina]
MRTVMEAATAATVESLTPPLLVCDASCHSGESDTHLLVCDANCTGPIGIPFLRSPVTAVMQ